MKNSLEDLGKQAEDNPARLGRKIIFWIIGLGILISCTMWVVRIASTPAKLIEKTLDPDNIIQNYEWFKQQVQDYNAINAKIVQSDTAVAHFVRDAGERSKWSFDDKQEFSRLNSISDGLKYQRADIAGKYNARSQMYNRDIFKTNDLPPTLAP